MEGLITHVEVAVENITLEGERTLCTMLSSTVHDVLYHMSPINCQDIIDSRAGYPSAVIIRLARQGASLQS